MSAYRVTAGLVRTVKDLFASQPAFDYRLDEIGRFHEGAKHVLYLRPDPAARFVTLTEMCVARWPRLKPYGGAYDEVIPHLTVAEGDAEPSGLSERVGAALPIAARADAVWLMTSTRHGGWKAIAILPLG